MDFSLRFEGLGLEDELVVDDPMKIFAQEIYAVLTTGENEFISDDTAGEVNLQQILDNRSVANEFFENRVRDAISYKTNGSAFFNYRVSLRFVRGQVSDIALLRIQITDPNDPGRVLNQDYRIQ